MFSKSSLNFPKISRKHLCVLDKIVLLRLRSIFAFHKYASCHNEPFYLEGQRILAVSLSFSIQVML